MIRLRTGYVISGIITGCILLITFLGTIPDGKLHVIFCDVGQGDGIYVRFPDGRDLIIDGGPNDRAMVNCLSHHMPFWDRTIDIAVLTHPQKDHMDGFVTVLLRYRVSHLLRSDVTNGTEGFDALERAIRDRHIEEKLVTTGQTVEIGNVALQILWPTNQQIASMHIPVSSSRLSLERGEAAVLGSSTTGNVNDASVVVKLSYGVFDVLFPGDADSHVDSSLIKEIPFDSDGLEVLKVPHHGSKTGMTDAFLDHLSKTSFARPGLAKLNNGEAPVAVISVGKNSYGHPAQETITKLEQNGFRVHRTDKEGDIEIVSDGKGWEVEK